MNFKFLTRTLILALAGCVLTVPALAEWQWLDKEGRKVFSDQPPPIDTPQKNIIKKPEFKADIRSQAVAAGRPALAASAPAVKTNIPKLSGKDKELEAMKKKADMLDETKKQAEVEKFAKSRADNCERAKKAQASLNSGIRIATTNTKGEREYMDDAARSAETKRLQSIAESDCVK
jgi:hypothetical protein